MGRDYYAVGMVLVALLAILNLANLALGIWAKTRRKPPIDVTLQDYARREEIEKVREEIGRLREETRDNDRQIFDLLRQQQARNMEAIGRLSDQLSAWQRGIERQIGRIEGSARGNGE